MANSVRKAAWIGAVFAVLTFGLLIWGALRSFEHSCRVCIRFEGRVECREAWGKTPDEATRTATDNACGLLTSGMTKSIQCGNTTPQSVTCEP